MPFKHGKATELWLDAINVSEFFNDLTLDVDVDVAETSTFSGSYKTYIEGNAASKVTAKGFYDKVNDAALATALRNGGSVLTYFPAGATAIGDLGRLVSIHESSLGESSPVGGAVIMSYNAQGDAIVGYGWALHLMGVDTGTTTGATRDDTAATSTGWTAHLHVTAVTGSPTSWTVKIQDSADGGSWADVTGGSFTATTIPVAQRLRSAALTTQLRRYVRYVATVVGGAGPTITFGLAYSRQ